jgi:tetratricopeptide (TPR) repeat protein
MGTGRVSYSARRAIEGLTMQDHRAGTGVGLTAALVVRNESERLPGALASLSGLADEIVVYDTGSTDGTVALARAAGARVAEGFWDDDFARARNAVLDLARTDWVLMLDADERVVPSSDGDRAALRHLLALTGHDVLTLTIENTYPEELGGDYSHPAPRLLRRKAVRFVGRIHEQPASRDGGTMGTVPPSLLSLDHLGYADAEAVRAKASRNVEIALAELDRRCEDRDCEPATIARILLNAGRGLVVCGRHQEAVDALEAVRSLVPGTTRALEATDALARLLLAVGMDEAVLVLAEELRDGGAEPRYCDWLRAQALAQVGHPEEALDLLRGVDLLRDPSGRNLDLGQVSEMRALVAGLAGRADEASRALASAMVRYGRIRGRGAILLGFWGDRPPAGLASLLEGALGEGGAGDSGGARLGEVAAEFAGCRDPGPEVARALLAGA